MAVVFMLVFVVFKEILTAESDSLLGVDMRRARGVEVLHSQLPWTKQSKPSTHHLTFTDCLL